MIVTGLLATALSIKAQNPDLGLHGRWGVGVGVGGGDDVAMEAWTPTGIRLGK